MRAAGGALAITSIAWTANVITDGATAGTTGDTADVFKSLGAFAAALAVAYFMLRRGDKRENEMLKASAHDIEKLRSDLMQATDRLVAALIENASLKADLLRLKDHDR